MSSGAEGRPSRRWLLLCCLLLLSGGGLVLWRVTAPHGWVYSPVRFDQRRMDDAVRWVRSHYRPGAGPIVVLPPSLAGVSVTGRAYVTDGLVFIPTWIGDRWRYDPDRVDASWLEGFVHSEKPIKIDPHDPFGVIYVPAQCRREDAKKNTGSGDREMNFQDPVDRGKHWYPVDSFS